MPWLLLTLAVAAEVVGTTALKLSNGFTDWKWSSFSLLAYAVAFVFLAKVLQVLPIGVTYALWSGLGTAFVVLIGWVAFGQKLDAAALLGIALIVSGVLVLNLMSGSGSH